MTRFGLILAFAALFGLAEVRAWRRRWATRRWAYYTDVNARLQSQAIGLGGEVNYLTPAEGAKADAVNLIVIDRVWNLWKMRLAPTPAK